MKKNQENINIYDNYIDWKEFEQLHNESYIDYTIRFSKRYSCLLDAFSFIPDYYQVVYDYYKQPHILLITGDEISYDL